MRMGLYLRPNRYVGLRRTRRGWRVSIGPRWLRLHIGAGGDGVSTGAGPFSYYKPLRRHRKRNR